MSDRWRLWTDGGARGNPGPAGAGFVLEDPNGAVVRRGGRFLGETTNNVAEYSALLLGLQAAAEAGATDLEVRADSELMVRQLNGHYRVKNAGLAPLYAEAVRSLSRFGSTRIVHVKRSENAVADSLANEAMDLRGPCGDEVGGHVAPPRLFE